MQREDTYVADPESSLEMTRLIEQDRIVTKGMGGIFPEYSTLPDSITHILDIGCGSGGWVLDVAYQYPRCEVVGLDVSTTLLNYARAQAKTQNRTNAIFVHGNVLNPLEFADQEFDLVNIRFAVAFLLREAWPYVLRELFRILRPGGVIHITEIDTISINHSPALEQLNSYLYLTLHKLGYGFSSDGKTLGITPALKGLLTDAGFGDIQLFPHTIDFSFHTELHYNQYENYIASSTIMLPLVIQHGIASEQAYTEVVNHMQFEMLQEDFQGTWLIQTAHGIKPAVATEKEPPRPDQ
jgi:ubiquinone/menaquinone biosynthesis C-methylase UbiE